jgi:hypothetical protein
VRVVRGIGQNVLDYTARALPGALVLLQDDLYFKAGLDVLPGLPVHNSSLPFDGLRVSFTGRY